ncbi:MAG: hypothetical protein ACLUIE_10745 [Parabacteroides merdae]
MEKSRFDIISDLFKLSNVISGSLKLAESLADKSSGSDETDCKDICRNIRYSLKPLPFLLAGIREYVTEHEDKDLARKFVGLHDDTKRLHGICSKYTDLNKAAFRTEGGLPEHGSHKAILLSRKRTGASIAGRF